MRIEPGNRDRLYIPAKDDVEPPDVSGYSHTCTYTRLLTFATCFSYLLYPFGLRPIAIALRTTRRDHIRKHNARYRHNTINDQIELEQHTLNDITSQPPTPNGRHRTDTGRHSK